MYSKQEICIIGHIMIQYLWLIFIISSVISLGRSIWSYRPITEIRLSLQPLFNVAEWGRTTLSD
jgi:hypothetical protein